MSIKVQSKAKIAASFSDYLVRNDRLSLRDRGGHYGSVSVDKWYKSDVLVRVCLRQQSDIHQSENEGSNPSAPVSERNSTG